MLKKLTVAALGGLVALTSPAVAQDDMSAVKSMLDKQQEEIKNLREQLKKQQSVHNEAVSALHPQ